MAAVSETNIPTSNMEVLVGHCLRETQVVGIQRGKELSYGTEAQVRGTGRILIYKIDVWQIFDFDIDAIDVIVISFMTRCHQRRTHSFYNKKRKSYSFFVVVDLFQMEEEAAENSSAHS